MDTAYGESAVVEPLCNAGVALETSISAAKYAFAKKGILRTSASLDEARVDALLHNPYFLHMYHWGLIELDAFEKIPSITNFLLEKFARMQAVPRGSPTFRALVQDVVRQLLRSDALHDAMDGYIVMPPPPPPPPHQHLLSPPTLAPAVMPTAARKVWGRSSRGTKVACAAFVLVKGLRLYEYISYLGMDPLQTGASKWPIGFTFFATAVEITVTHCAGVPLHEAAALRQNASRILTALLDLLFACLSIFHIIRDWDADSGGRRMLRGQALLRIEDAMYQLRYQHPNATAEDDKKLYKLGNLGRATIAAADQTDYVYQYLIALGVMTVGNRALQWWTRRKERPATPEERELGAIYWMQTKVLTALHCGIGFILLLRAVASAAQLSSEGRGTAWAQTVQHCLESTGLSRSLGMERVLMNALSEWQHLPARSLPPEMLVQLGLDSRNMLFAADRAAEGAFRGGEIQTEREFLEYTGHIVSYWTLLYGMSGGKPMVETMLPRPPIFRGQHGTDSNASSALRRAPEERIWRNTDANQWWGNKEEGFSRFGYDYTNATTVAARLEDDDWYKAYGIEWGVLHFANQCATSAVEMLNSWFGLNSNIVIRNIHEDLRSEDLTRSLFPRWYEYFRKHERSALVVNTFLRDAEPSIRAFLHYGNRETRAPSEFLMARCCGPQRNAKDSSYSTSSYLGIVERFDTRLAKLLPLVAKFREPEFYARQHLVTYMASRERVPSGFYMNWEGGDGAVQRQLAIMRASEVPLRLRWTPSQERASWETMQERAEQDFVAPPMEKIVEEARPRVVNRFIDLGETANSYVDTITGLGVGGLACFFMLV